MVNINVYFIVSVLHLLCLCLCLIEVCLYIDRDVCVEFFNKRKHTKDGILINGTAVQQFIPHIVYSFYIWILPEKRNFSPNRNSGKNFAFETEK